MKFFSFLFFTNNRKNMKIYQNEVISKHYEEIENTYKQIRAFKHDYKNHIQTMKNYLYFNEINALNEYLDKLDEELNSMDTIIKTGNIALDAILNVKISAAKSMNIKVDAKASAPEISTIYQTDLCIVLGNLLDNAIEACSELEDISQRFIRIYINLFKEQFYISITNSAQSKSVYRIGKKFISHKGRNHGFGIQNIDRTVKKYNGYINRQVEEGVFATEIMIPL